MTITPTDILTLLGPPFAVSVLFVAIHANFGLHVLRRGVIFVDLALAQMSALGATVAFAAGHVPTSPAGLAYALLFSAIGAALLTAGRMLPKSIHTEAYIGILYVVATAATILVVDRSPQGAEHVKQILVGSILTVNWDDLPKPALVYGAIGIFHWLARRPLLAASEGRSGSPLVWDFLFYLSFGVVVTSSVAIAGVLLVFCFLIIPAIIGSLFTRRIAGALWIGWLSGAIASAIGLAASLALDLPAGAAMVLSFGLVLCVAMVVYAFVSVPAAARITRLYLLMRATSAIVLTTVAAAMIWLMAMPRADQPLLHVLEWATGIGPTAFLTTEERQVYASAEAEARFRQSQATCLTTSEQQARWDGEPLSDEAVRQIGTFQQAYSEMARGEDFVRQALTEQARERERWYLGPALLAAALLGLLATLPRGMRMRLRQWLRTPLRRCA